MLKHSPKKLTSAFLASVLAFFSVPFLQARSGPLRTADPQGGEKVATSQKLQNELRLSPQKNLMLAFAGNDDCPGQPIPGGNYTSSTPYTDTGDTTGANSTVDSLLFDFGAWGSEWSTPGPDHVYSFTMTSRGANPQIQVSSGNSSYSPFIYILEGGNGGCPIGSDKWGRFTWFVGFPSEPATPGGTATISSQDINTLPLNVRLHLFIDSGYEPSNSGPYTLRLQDVTISGPTTTPNPIDSPEFFVRQHYKDFLGRDPEPSGLAAWMKVLNNCAAGDLVCLHEQRLTTSVGFFGSLEFHLKGYFAFRFYRVAFGRLPEYSEISPDIQSLIGSSPGVVYSRKSTFTNDFVRRSEFVGLYNGLPNAAYVSALFDRYGLISITTPNPANPDGDMKMTLTQAQLVSGLDGGTFTRAQVLRAVADSDELFHTEYNQAFVAMLYYGYLRRTPETGGFNSWMNHLNTHPGDFRRMVQGFVDSTEYRNRFGI